MGDTRESIPVHLEKTKPADSGTGKGWIHGLQRRIILGLSTAALVLLCAIHASVAIENNPRAAAIGYLCFALAFFGCAAVFLGRARSFTGRLRIRWGVFAAGALAAGIGFVPSFTEVVLGTGPARLIQTPCFNASEALYMLAAVLFFSGVGRAIVFVDLLQALLFVVLRFNLLYSPATRDHFTRNHLLISQLVALFLFLVAMVGCMGAATWTELKFLRALSWFFGLRFVAYFLADQVSYVWLGYVHSSLCDLAGPVLLGGFALYLLYTSEAAKSEAREAATQPRPSVLVRSLMPSFLAIVNLMLGLFVLRISFQMAAAAISVSLVCYVARTVLLQAQAAKENAILESRNEQLEGLAIRDPLTGIGNRRSLAGVYARMQTPPGGEWLSLLLMDIDSFKQANDCHGHLHGDRVLIALARKLEKVAAGLTGSHCARLGGDEFALLLANVSHEDASELAEMLRASFGEHGFGQEFGRVSLSVGVATLRAASDLPLETLICYADEALYRAKLLGRNRVEVQPVWEPESALGIPAAPELILELQHTGT